MAGAIVNQMLANPAIRDIFLLYKFCIKFIHRAGDFAKFRNIYNVEPVLC